MIEDDEAAFCGVLDGVETSAKRRVDGVVWSPSSTGEGLRAAGVLR
jgi:hypothetical protein